MTLLSKWEPLREIEELFNRPWPWPAGRGSALQGLSDWTPRLDNGVVTIQGERRQEKEEENKRFHRVERFYGSFTRSFTLPDDADASGLKATARDGQLTVTIPKRTSEPSSTAVQVPVE